MTTIAFKEGIIAADTRVVIGTISLYGRKIQKLDQYVFAIAGKLPDEAIFIDYYKGERKRVPRKFSSLEAFKVEENQVYWCNNDLYWQPIPAKGFYALGSGWQIAMAGMHMGLSAKDAVLLAGDLDINTNKLVDTYNVKTKRLTLQPLPR